MANSFSDDLGLEDVISGNVGRKKLSSQKPEKMTKDRHRKISRRKPGQKISNYFTMDTQASIIKYQEAKTKSEKEQIYVKEILPAFDSLVENLINVYGFKVMLESKQDLKNECLEFLYTAVSKFDHTKGSKAFSYFNVVAKNWLTIKSKQNAKKSKQYISLDYQEALSQADIETIENYSTIPSYDEVITPAEMNDLLFKVIEELDNRVKTENEKMTLEAIKLIASQIDDLDLLSKRAVLLYIREITGFGAKQLSVLLASLKKHYRDLKKSDEFNLR